MPEIPIDVTIGTATLSVQQKNNVCVFVYSLSLRNETHYPQDIWRRWPIEGDPYKLQRAGKRPSITAIQQYMATDEFVENMSSRGIELEKVDGPGSLMPEQIALISILSDSTSRAGISTRLKRAGVSNALYQGWRRQKPFADALAQATGGALTDAIGGADVQLAQMAQNGDLNAIKYLNDMVGRGPNDRKAVDAAQFARIVLEAVQKVVSQEQARAISAEIDLATKAIGLS